MDLNRILLQKIKVSEIPRFIKLVEVLPDSVIETNFDILASTIGGNYDSCRLSVSYVNSEERIGIKFNVPSGASDTRNILGDAIVNFDYHGHHYQLRKLYHFDDS